MAKDKRKARRKHLHYAAWIGDGDQLLQGCIVADVSEGGARLDCGDPAGVPEEFVLILTDRQEGARRRCRVIWRSEKQIGVEFEMRYAADSRVRQFKAAASDA